MDLAYFEAHKEKKGYVREGRWMIVASSVDANKIGKSLSRETEPLDDGIRDPTDAKPSYLYFMYFHDFTFVFMP